MSGVSLQVDDVVLVPLPSGRQKVVLLFKCPHCNEKKEIDDFGIRKMGNGQLRKQPWCRPCRSASAADSKARGKDGAAA